MAGANNFKAQRKFINSFKGDPESSVLQTTYLEEKVERQIKKTKPSKELSPSQFLLSDIAEPQRQNRDLKR